MFEINLKAGVAPAASCTLRKTAGDVEGMSLMKFTRFAIHAFVVALMLSGVSVRQEAGAAEAGGANDAFFGDWKFNPSKSRLVDEMKVQSVGAGLYVFDFGGGEEKIAANGTDQPAGFGTTLSVTAERSGSWKIVRKQNGRAIVSAIWTLSKDGKTLRDAFTSIPEQGPPATTQLVYARTAGGPGFAGIWDDTSAATNLAFVLQVREYRGDGISFFNPSQKQTRNMRFDGRDYPTEGSPGLTSSMRRIDAHAIEMTDKLNGKIIDTRRVEVSADRKTLTETVYKKGQTLPGILVLERV